MFKTLIRSVLALSLAAAPAAFADIVTYDFSGFVSGAGGAYETYGRDSVSGTLVFDLQNAQNFTGNISNGNFMFSTSTTAEAPIFAATFNINGVSFAVPYSPSDTFDYSTVSNDPVQGYAAGEQTNSASNRSANAELFNSNLNAYLSSGLPDPTQSGYQVDFEAINSNLGTDDTMSVNVQAMSRVSDVSTSSVPAPMAPSMLGLGLLGLLAVSRKRQLS